MKEQYNENRLNKVRAPVTISHTVPIHADDMFACAALKIMDPDMTFLQSRDPVEWKRATYLVDVGGEYDPERGRFDHHQGGIEPRPNGVPYASFGLVMRHLHERILNAVGCFGDEVAEVYEMLESKLVQGVDAADCAYTPRLIVGGDMTADDCWGYLVGWEGGPEHVELKEREVRIGTPEAVRTLTFRQLPPNMPGAGITVSEVISSINATWESQEDTNGAMAAHRVKTAIALAESILRQQIRRCRSVVRARVRVEQACDACNDGVLVLERFMPWQRVVAKAPGIKLVLFPAPDGASWRIQVVDTGGRGSAPRLELPRPWWGKSGEHLQELTGVAGAIFCHINGFIMGVTTREEATALAHAVVAGEGAVEAASAAAE